MGHALIEAIAFFPVCFAFHPMQWTINIPPSDAFFITLPVYFGLNSRFKNADGYRTVIGENKQRSCGNFITIISKQMILLNFVLLLKNHRTSPIKKSFYLSKFFYYKLSYSSYNESHTALRKRTKMMRKSNEPASTMNCFLSTRERGE